MYHQMNALARETAGRLLPVLTFCVAYIVIVATNSLLLEFSSPSNALDEPSTAKLLAEYSTDGTGNLPDKHLPTTSSVTVERIYDRPATPAPNFYDYLLSKDCLEKNSTLWECQECLKSASTQNCTTCDSECGCFCTYLCQESTLERFVSKDIVVTPPGRDASRRRIPRIVHQIWNEPIDAERYPRFTNFSRTFQTTHGWDYRFYTTDDARAFIGSHFPQEVREAFDDVIPGAFKADLFRYCVLLVHGGVYADMDMRLETDLDNAIDPDAGFVTLLDPNRRIHVEKSRLIFGPIASLPNGFLASAAGHPFLAKAIETVVNQVRNRYNTVDFQESMCPNPPLFSIAHIPFLLLSCVLGQSANQVIERRAQTPIEAPGRLIVSEPHSQQILDQLEKDFGVTILLDFALSPTDAWTISTVTSSASNNASGLMVATVNHPNIPQDKPEVANQHYYSGAQRAADERLLYGQEGVYVDQRKANEHIRLRVKNFPTKHQAV